MPGWLNSATVALAELLFLAVMIAGDWFTVRQLSDESTDGRELLLPAFRRHAHRAVAGVDRCR